MPFGLKCASNSFIRAVQQIVKPIREFKDSYGDDIATFSNDWGYNVQHIHSFLTEMRKSGMTLKLEKCEFAQFARPQITFVGHIIGSGRHGPDPNKVACVESMVTHTNKTEVRQMLGFFSYFRTYIHQFAEVARTLTELTKSRFPIGSSGRQSASKLLTCSNTFMWSYQTSCHGIGQPCGILADASCMAVGCCLIQWTDTGQEKPIAFTSAKLTLTQSCWSTIEREAYAVVCKQSFESYRLRQMSRAVWWRRKSQAARWRSTVITATSVSYPTAKMEILTPVKSKPLNRLTHNLSWLITSKRGTFAPNFVKIRSRRTSGQRGEI